MHKSKTTGHLIAKLQYFADEMNQRRKDKETLAIATNERECKEGIKTEILIYEQIIEEYNEIFKEILYK